MNQRPLGRWATEAKAHLQKYRPKMASQLEQEGKLDDWATSAANRARDQAGLSIENGMFPLEAESEAKKQHMLLLSDKNMPILDQDSDAPRDPAGLVSLSRLWVGLSQRTTIGADEGEQYLTLRGPILPVCPLDGIAREVGVHSFTQCREEIFLTEMCEEPKALQFVFDRVFHFSKTQLNASRM